jgi:hypothetical protein
MCVKRSARIIRVLLNRGVQKLPSTCIANGKVGQRHKRTARKREKRRINERLVLTRDPSRLGEKLRGVFMQIAHITNSPYSVGFCAYCTHKNVFGPYAPAGRYICLPTVLDAKSLTFVTGQKSPYLTIPTLELVRLHEVRFFRQRTRFPRFRKSLCLLQKFRHALLLVVLLSKNINSISASLSWVAHEQESERADLGGVRPRRGEGWGKGGRDDSRRDRDRAAREIEPETGGEETDVGE